MEPHQPSPDAKPSTDNKFPMGLGILIGLSYTVCLHLLQILLSGIGLFWFFGVTQLLYMVPAMFYYKKQNQNGIVVGLIIGASLTFILGIPFAGCGLMLMNVPRN